MSHGFKQMESVAAMMLDVELARLHALSRDMAEHNAALQALTKAREARAAALQAGSPDGDFAFLRGQDALWAAWLLREGAQKSREVAELGVRREEQRLRTKTAFGKREALRQIRLRATTAERRKKDRQSGL